MKGKADFNALSSLYLNSSTSSRNIQSLAKLVNRGHCEWGQGDIVTSDQGDFVNFGTVQMMNGQASFSSNIFYKGPHVTTLASKFFNLFSIGTELPIENGGDVFALDYHSWDMDQVWTLIYNKFFLCCHLFIILYYHHHYHHHCYYY